MTIGLAWWFGWQRRRNTMSKHTIYRQKVCANITTSWLVQWRAACVSFYLWWWVRVLKDWSWMECCCCGWSTQSWQQPSLPFYSFHTATHRTGIVRNTPAWVLVKWRFPFLLFNAKMVKFTFAIRIPVTQRFMDQASSQQRYLMYWDSFWIWGCCRVKSK